MSKAKADKTAQKSESEKTESEKTVQVTIRVPLGWRTRAENIASALSPAGKKLSQMDGFRAAIAIGFEQLEKKFA